MQMKNENKQYDKILSPKEINEIADEELKNIRLSYWKKRHDAFLDDNIPEGDLDAVINSLFELEQAEINRLRSKKGDI